MLRLNGLFALLLEEVGFVVRRLAARVLYGTEGVRPRSHQVLLVHLDGECWIVDVGFGGQALREPLPLTVGEEHRQGPDRFRFTSDERGESVLQCRIEEVWANLYPFTLEPWLPVDLYHANPAGRKSLIDTVFKVRDQDGTQELRVTSEWQCKMLLQEQLGLVLNDHLSS
ncbi:MAG: arylamine N-acetyltransferase [Nitrospira sp.]|nr:arylamine N-acetyltransferase [Nitrospira sp.]